MADSAHVKRKKSQNLSVLSYEDREILGPIEVDV
jgi:hypothetical protein